MKISLHWLQDYVDLSNFTVEEISTLLTDIGLEVEGIEQFESIKGGLAGLVVGEVLSCEPHENADRLQVCTVDTGQESPLQIVCGAPNVAKGQKVIVAPVNTTIHPLKGEEFTINKAKIRGVESRGMICAEDEIGLGDSHDGIMVLPNTARVGQPAAELFEITQDTIFEIGLTPNRSDAQSHIGVARDLVAAIETQYQKNMTLHWPKVGQFSIDNEDKQVEILLEDPEACPRYAGLVITSITIGPSPQWMQNRLQAIGIKPINNIVDITNYINHEYGQPLHAFDWDQVLGNTIVIKKAKEGEKFTTLDGVERTLSNEDLMICNKKEPMCIAGVYGGLKSGVSNQTTSIFLESAYFDPGTIRRTELRHNLRTDAATKFEKGVDPTLQVEVLKRAALLIQEFAGGVVSSELHDLYPHPIDRKIVSLSFERLNQLTGINFDQSQAVTILNALEFEVKHKMESQVQLAVPQFRSDVYREADVIEEILRIYGFNNVPSSLGVSFPLSYHHNSLGDTINKVSDMLAGKGFAEIITNSLTKRTYYENMGYEESEFVQPINSINKNLDLLRPDMVFTGLEVISYNCNRNITDLQCFEFGKVYSKKNDTYIEDHKLALYLTGNKYLGDWQETKKAFTYFDLKQNVIEIFKRCNCNEWQEETISSSMFSYGQSFKVNNKEVVTLGVIRSEVLEKTEVKQNVFFAEIDVAFLEKQRKKSVTYIPPSKFPSIQRDLALVINQNVNYDDIESIAKKYGGKYLTNLALIDVFENEEKLGKGKKSYAISMTFEDKSQTLTNQQIDKQVQKLIKQFEEQIDATIRT